MIFPKIQLFTLIALLLAYALMAMTYLAVSARRVRVGGKPLSAAPIRSAMIAFIFLIGCQSLPYQGQVVAYRIAMAILLLPMFGKGVIGNILRYRQGEGEGFRSFSAYLGAVGINIFGSIWLAMAAIGAFELNP